MIKGEHERLKALAEANVCGEDGGILDVAWHSGEKCWTIRCGEGHYPGTITRQPSLTERLKQGAELPEPIKSNGEKGMRKRAMAQGGRGGAVTMGGVPAVDLGTGELLDSYMVRALAVYAQRYHLDPHRSHVVLMYGKPYITLDGYLFHAKQSGRPYTLSSRPLTTVEEAQYKIEKTDHAWVAEVQFTDTLATFTGLGVVTYEEMTARSPRDNSRLRSPVVAAHPWQLAQKRAEWQALRRAFPIGGEGEEVDVSHDRDQGAPPVED